MISMILLGVVVSCFAQNDDRYEYDEGTVYVRIADTARADTDSLLRTLGFDLSGLEERWTENDCTSELGWTLSKFSTGMIELRQDLDKMVNQLDIKELFRTKFWEEDYKSAPSDVTWGLTQRSDRTRPIYPAEKYRFHLIAPGARHVVLSGTFNQWDTEELVMSKGENSEFFIDLNMPPGQHLYKFIVDDEWMVDPQNDLTMFDWQGNENSVFYAPDHIFRLEGFQDAKRVILAGNFNDWDERELEMYRRDGAWELPIYLRPNTYFYKFIVDGQWVTDPHNESTIEDENGYVNSVLEHGDAFEFELDGFADAQKVYLAGTFNAWDEHSWPMTKMDDGTWHLRAVMHPGNYEYRFIVDGEWYSDPGAGRMDPEVEWSNNVVAIHPNHTFRLDDFPKASNVRVTGDFFGWNEQGLPMTWNGDAWVAEAFLPMGKTKYRFIVDGEWMQDFDNPWYEKNGYGEVNSVIWKKLEGYRVP